MSESSMVFWGQKLTIPGSKEPLALTQQLLGLATQNSILLGLEPAPGGSREAVQPSAVSGLQSPEEAWHSIGD